MSLAFIKAILVEFTDDALVLTEEGRPPVTIPYRDHPDIFGHPRSLMIGTDQSAALVVSAIKELKGSRFPLIAPKFAVTIERRLEGGITENDRKDIEEILMKAGARKVEFPTTSVFQK